ncbi:hypothetical protein P12x_006171 (plasmid) [Tundrisphaera lichenicola]|uniref:hypothetical protein n=1 Tax=Tundrisphaera lichenicola TaxID=2029860 RepID=UPI003EC0D748
MKIHDYSLYIAAVVTVKAGTTILQSPKLRGDANRLLTSAAGPDAFRKLYGDVFLAGVTLGGELILFMEIQYHNRSDFESINASIKASDILGINQGSASFQSSLQKITSSYSITIKHFQRGGSDADTPLTPENLASKASTFANTVT